MAFGFCGGKRRRSMRQAGCDFRSVEWGLAETEWYVNPLWPSLPDLCLANSLPPAPGVPQLRLFRRLLESARAMVLGYIRWGAQSTVRAQVGGRALKSWGMSAAGTTAMRCGLSGGVVRV